MKKVFLPVAILLIANLSHAQWEPDVQLTTNIEPGGSWTSQNNQWCVAAGGDTVHAVWYDSRDLDKEIYYKRSTDGGTSWGDDVRLTNCSGSSMNPCISLSGSIVHVAWCDARDGNYEVYYKQSTDRGATWGDDVRLTVYSGNSFNPSVAVNGLVINMVWYDNRDGNWEIYSKRSTDGGLTWEPDTRQTYDPANSFNASAAVSCSTVHVVWGEYRDGPTGEIYYKRSTDDGFTWGQDVRLTIDADSSRRPCVAVSGSVVHVAWFDYRDGDSEIYYKRSDDAGTTWGPDIRLTNSTGRSIDPSIAVSGSAVHVVWDDKRDGNEEIYYKKSEDKGLNWGPDIRLTDDTSISKYPSIAISGPVIHTVWTDYRDAGWMDIFYKRNPTDGFAVGSDHGPAVNPYGQVRICPNPAAGLLHVHLIGSHGEIARMTIQDIFGEVIFNRIIVKDETVIDVSSLQNGLYFLNIALPGKQAETRKLIIQK